LTVALTATPDIEQRGAGDPRLAIGGLESSGQTATDSQADIAAGVAHRAISVRLTLPSAEALEPRTRSPALDAASARIGGPQTLGVHRAWLAERRSHLVQADAAAPVTKTVGAALAVVVALVAGVARLSLTFAFALTLRTPL
jgi:hypothetical protein